MSLFPNTSISLVRKHLVVIACLLFTWLALNPTLDNGWVNWDDPGYVLENELIQEFSSEKISEIFSTGTYMGNYQPLTLFTYSLEYNQFGSDAAHYHQTNLWLHLINVGLAYWLIFLLCGRVEVAAVTALLFGIHPMHLESVAWISSRKDVLYAFFFLLALVSYETGKRKSGQKWASFIITLFLFLCAVLSKGMAVVFPLILLLLDYLNKRKFNRSLWLEKAPYFLLSLFFGFLALWAQQEGNAMANRQDFPFYEAPLMAGYSLLLYLIKALVPFQMSVHHPYPMVVADEIPVYFFALVILIGLGIVIWKKARTNRTVLFGLGFFVVSIGPVLQLLSVGNAMMAERYTYLAYLGLFFLFSTVLFDLAERIPGKKAGLIKLGILVYLLVLGFVTFNRAEVWKDDEQLWSEVIEVYPEDHFAYHKRAVHRSLSGKQELALDDYNSCLAIYPYFLDAANNRGMIYLEQRQWESAFADFSTTITIDSSYFKGYLNRGLIYMNTGRFQEALVEFGKSLELKPDFSLGYLNRGVLLEKMGYPQNAEWEYGEVIVLQPNDPVGYKYRGVARFTQGKWPEALVDFSHVIELDSTQAAAYFWRAKTYLALQQPELARQEAQLANQLGYPIPANFKQSLGL